MKGSLIAFPRHPDAPTGSPAVRLFSSARSAVCAALLLTLIAGIPCTLAGEVTISSTADRPSHPNVILIVVDTLRADHLSFHGSAHRTSPNLDRLAGDSLVFQQARAVAPWTLPSIASMMTGYHPAVLGIRGKKGATIDQKLTTLAELFKQNGYRTAGIISHTFLQANFGFGQGFDTFNAKETGGGLHISSPGVTRHAIKYLRKVDKRPFFLFLHYFDPHDDYILHELYNHYPEYQGHLLKNTRIHQQRTLAEKKLLVEEDRRYLKAVYDTEISLTDYHLGRLFRSLKKHGLYRDSLIVFTADHGEEFAERPDNWIGHTRRVSEAMIRVPLLIKLPHGRFSGLVRQPVSLVDLMPTIASSAGIELPKGMQLSGAAIDLAEPSRSRQVVFAETEHGTYKYQTVIWNQWKLILDRQLGSNRLYDLEQDPRETLDLAKNQQAVFGQMKRNLDDWLKNQAKLQKQLKPGAKQPRLSPKQVKQLRSLGYIE